MTSPSEAAAAFVRDYPDWLPPRLADALAALVRAERAAVREACAAAVCDGCREGWPLHHELAGCHVRPDGLPVLCEADDFRALPIGE
jgi:hypothetical protein